MNNDLNMTQIIDTSKINDSIKPDEVITIIHSAMIEKGYNPVKQLTGYILSGDPTYITSHKNARSFISQIDRDELLEELITSYIKQL